MALLFAEKGITVLLEDPSEENVNSVLATARQDGLEGLLEKHQGYGELCKNLGSPKVFIFSLPHGTVGDSVVEGLHPYLEKGDVIIDASNEHWENTQRRQGKLIAMGVFYVGKSSISACSLGGMKKQTIHDRFRHGCFWRVPSCSERTFNVSWRRGSCSGFGATAFGESSSQGRPRKGLCAWSWHGRCRSLC